MAGSNWRRIGLTRPPKGLGLQAAHMTGALVRIGTGELELSQCLSLSLLLSLHSLKEDREEEKEEKED